MELWGFETRGFEVVGEPLSLLQQVPVKTILASTVTIKPRAGTTVPPPTPPSAQRLRGIIPVPPVPTPHSRFIGPNLLVDLGRARFGFFTASELPSATMPLLRTFLTPPPLATYTRQILETPREIPSENHPSLERSLNFIEAGRGHSNPDYPMAISTVAQVARQAPTRGSAQKAFERISYWVRDTRRTDHRLILRAFTAPDPKLIPYSEVHIAFLFEVASSSSKAAPDAIEALATAGLVSSNPMSETSFQHLLKLALPSETSKADLSPTLEKIVLQNISRIADSRGPLASRALNALIEAREMGSLVADELLGKIQLPADPLSHAQLNALVESGNVLARVPLMNILESFLPVIRKTPDRILKPLHDEMMRSLIIIATEELPAQSPWRPVQKSARETLNRLFSNIYDAKSLEALLRRLFFLRSLGLSTAAHHGSGRDPRRSRSLALLMAYWDMVTYLDGQKVLEKLIPRKSTK